MSSDTSTAIPLPDAYHSSRLLTVQQVSEMMAISVRTIKRLMKNPKDPLPCLHVGGSVRFKLDKVIWWIDNRPE